MCSRSDRRRRFGSGRRVAGREWTALFAALAIAGSTAAYPLPPARRALRVCADPNNLPFSNAKQEGFENALARLFARELGDSLEYYWWPQRRAWVRHTMGEGKCDVAIGVPASFDPLTTTQPYYRSTYVFVSRADRRYDLHSLDDPRLRTLRIGLHFIGTDYSNPPPAHALGARGIVRNVVGYSIYGNFRDANPPARLIEAVARGDVDVAIVWGPLAGYFAAREPVKLVVTPVEPALDPRTGIRFDFPIAVGVRKGDAVLRDAIQRVLDRRRSAVDSILLRYGVINSIDQTHAVAIGGGR
jgi:quinoprotein dehydrogenase-associated probable ABC transporter substrate-binding protein